MKVNFLLKSGFCMLVAVGTLTPITSVAGEQGTMDFGKSHLYSETPTSYYIKSETPTQYGDESEKMRHGAQGPIRNESMDDRGQSHLYSKTPTEYGK